jgi:methylated-DNA-[protein]-cysteine S-methyltransferase
VLEEARRIPAGETVTYGELAARAGSPGAAREVGQAMARNRFPIIVPCHRVLAANGGFGGFSAPGGLESKARLLTIERAAVGREPSLFDDLPIAVRPKGSA